MKTVTVSVYDDDSTEMDLEIVIKTVADPVEVMKTLARAHEAARAALP